MKEELKEKQSLYLSEMNENLVGFQEYPVVISFSEHKNDSKQQYITATYKNKKIGSELIDFYHEDQSTIKKNKKRVRNLSTRIKKDIVFKNQELFKEIIGDKLKSYLSSLFSPIRNEYLPIFEDLIESIGVEVFLGRNNILIANAEFTKANGKVVKAKLSYLLPNETFKTIAINNRMYEKDFFRYFIQEIYAIKKNYDKKASKQELVNNFNLNNSINLNVEEFDIFNRKVEILAVNKIDVVKVSRKIKLLVTVEVNGREVSALIKPEHLKFNHA